MVRVLGFFVLFWNINWVLWGWCLGLGFGGVSVGFFCFVLIFRFGF